MKCEIADKDVILLRLKNQWNTVAPVVGTVYVVWSFVSFTLTLLIIFDLPVIMPVVFYYMMATTGLNVLLGIICWFVITFRVK